MAILDWLFPNQNTPRSLELSTKKSTSRWTEDKWKHKFTRCNHLTRITQWKTSPFLWNTCHRIYPQEPNNCSTWSNVSQKLRNTPTETIFTYLFRSGRVFAKRRNQCTDHDLQHKRSTNCNLQCNWGFIATCNCSKFRKITTANHKLWDRTFEKQWRIQYKCYYMNQLPSSIHDMGHIQKIFFQHS